MAASRPFCAHTVNMQRHYKANETKNMAVNVTAQLDLLAARIHALWTS
jgi:hypothetical protein